MKNLIDIIAKASLVILVCVMATGCVFSKMDKANGLQNVLIQVNVSADEMTKSTAAVSTDDEAAINTIRIYAFYNGQLSGHYWRGSASGDPIIMDLLLPYNGVHNVDFYVIANEGAMVGAAGSPALGPKSTQQQLKAICMQGLDTPAENGLPLYFNGVIAVNVDNITSNNIQGHEEHYWLVQTLDVNLVRPVSKLAVYVAEAEQGTAVYQTDSPKLTVTSLEITNASSTGYLFDDNDATGDNAYGFVNDTDITVNRVIGEQNGTAITNSDNYTQILSPSYFFVNSNGGDNWSSGYVDQQTNLSQIANGAMMLKIGYSFDSGATSSYAYVKMPQMKRNVFYKVMCRFSPVGGHQEILISINEWNYITHTYDEVVVKSK